MKEILPGVYRVEGLRTSNVYLLADEAGLTLIDSGASVGDADKIVAQIKEAGFGMVYLKTIVVTHAHSDHTGGLAELVRRSGAQVLAHAEDAPYVEQTQSLPFGPWAQRALFWLFARLQPVEPCEVDQALQDGDTVEALGGPSATLRTLRRLQVIHAPGHTPGNIVLYQPERQILFCGDTFFHGGPMGRGDRVTLPPRIASIDVDQARASAEKVAALPLRAVCFGHGEPILDGPQEKLREAFG
jgi:glyoxylase-like metal-dependent hydrolase (beta-lactamase superfamily II)